jgi:hypothetical protein
MSSAVVDQEQSPFASPQERTREMALILEAAQSCDFSEALVWIIHRQPPRHACDDPFANARKTCRWLPGMPPGQLMTVTSL